MCVCVCVCVCMCVCVFVCVCSCVYVSMPPADFAMLPTANWREHDWVPVSVMIGEADKTSVCLNSPSIRSGQPNIFMLTLLISALHVHQGHTTANFQILIIWVNTYVRKSVPWNLLYSVLENSLKKKALYDFCVKNVNLLMWPWGEVVSDANLNLHHTAPEAGAATVWDFHGTIIISENITYTASHNYHSISQQWKCPITV